MLGDNDHIPAFFDWQGIHIYQDDRVHKVGTDAVLLGAWVASIISNPTSILDAGTGSGILAMMMAKSFPTSKIHGLDVDPGAIHLAMNNVKGSIYEQRISFSCEDILEASANRDFTFDLILSNPPYHAEHIKPVLDFRSRTKHLHIPESDWINSLLKRLTPYGHICIVVPFEASKKWIYAANEKGYYIQHRLDVFSFEADTIPKRSLLHFATVLKKPSIEEISIYKIENLYTDGYLNLTGIRPKK